MPARSLCSVAALLLAAVLEVWSVGSPCVLSLPADVADGWGTCTSLVPAGANCTLQCREHSSPVRGLCGSNGSWVAAPYCWGDPSCLLDRYPSPAASGWGSCDIVVYAGQRCSFTCARGARAREGSCVGGEWAPRPACQQQSAAVRTVAIVIVVALVVVALAAFCVTRVMWITRKRRRAAVSAALCSAVRCASRGDQCGLDASNVLTACYPSSGWESCASYKECEGWYLAAPLNARLACSGGVCVRPPGTVAIGQPCKSTLDCFSGHCVQSLCADPAYVPVGGACDSNSACTPGSACLAGPATSACVEFAENLGSCKSAPCPGVCDSGVCYYQMSAGEGDHCPSDLACGPGLICVSNKCAKPLSDVDTECSNASDCGSGYT
eukprot:m51a1_g13493 hypothetical protein (381) ;mRNA; r:244-2239